MYQGLDFQIAGIMNKVIQTGLLRESCVIQEPDGATTSTNAPSGNYVNVVGLDSIFCTSAVESNRNVTPNEERSLPQIEDTALRHVMLDANYPAILAGWRNGWRAIITYPDGTVTAYDIKGAETDSQTTHTRMKLQEVTV